MKKLLFLLFTLTFLFSQAEITNIQASQRTDGSQIVDITYDLAPTGATGGGGSGTLATLPGTLWSDYLYWDTTPGATAQWKVGSTGLHIGAHAGEFGPQGLAGTAVGFYAGYTGQSDFAVAMGASAAAVNQGANAIAIANANAIPREVFVQVGSMFASMVVTHVHVW